MGNSFSGSEKTILHQDNWDLTNLPDLKKSLGVRSSHIYSSFPKSSPENNVYCDMDLRGFSCQDGTKLNEFLSNVLSYLQGIYVKENWVENAFAPNIENIKLLSQELFATLPTAEEIDKIRNLLQLPDKIPVKTQITKETTGQETTGEEQETAGEEKEKETTGEEQETAGQETTTEKTTKEPVTVELERDVEQVYSGYSIYEFPDNGLGMALDYKKVGIESCFVANVNDTLRIVAPSEEPTLSRCIRFEWQVVQLTDNSLRLILTNARGVVFEGHQELVEVVDNQLDNLDKGFQSYKNKNSREMMMHTERYSKWVSQVQNQGELMALAGGEIDGDIISLSEFFDKMQL